MTCTLNNLLIYNHIHECIKFSLYSDKKINDGNFTVGKYVNIRPKIKLNFCVEF